MSPSLGDGVRGVVDRRQARDEVRKLPPFADARASLEWQAFPSPMNSVPSPDLAPYALTLVPIIFFLVYTVIVLGLLAFGVSMVLRFVRAHERIARSLETLAAKDSAKAP
jgi:hypothetical protein